MGYFKADKLEVISCDNQKEVSDVIKKLNTNTNAIWYCNKNEDPVEVELEKNIIKNSDNRYFYINHAIYGTLSYLTYSSLNTNDKSEIINDKKRIYGIESDEDISFTTAKEFLSDNKFSINYDVYDLNANFIKTVYNQNQLDELIQEVQDDSDKKYIIYIGSSEVVIDDEHDIDYYHEKISF